MNIGFDLDNTLFKENAVDKVSSELGFSGHTSANHTDWHMTSYPEVMRKRVYELFKDPGHMGNLTLIPGSKDFLHKLKGKGHKIYIVTARPSCLIPVTNKMVEQNLGDLIEEVYFVEPDQDKLSVLEQLGIDVWVDDAGHQVEVTVEAGMDTILISNERTKYNWPVRDKYEFLPTYGSVSEIPLEYFSS